MADLISRQAVLKELPYAFWGKEWDEALAKAIIESVPTVDPAENGGCWGCLCAMCEQGPVKHGEWITKKDNACGIEYTVCSNCETEIQWRDRHGVLLRVDMNNAPYCPNCGAQMGRSDNGKQTTQ